VNKFLAILIFLPVAAFAQRFQLSDSSRISILTLGPSQDEVYTAFGHTAIRVIDPGRGVDLTFNYGEFNFNQPHFYLNFTRGHLLYQLGVYNYSDFRDAYIFYNRFIHEQILNLTTVQKQKVFDFLLWNAQPENQRYLYDYFFNNCATKVRDVFAEKLKGEIQFDGSFIKTHYTIRDLTDLYLGQQPWGDLGIDICLGLPMDKKASPYEYMFLPDYIESSFDHAVITRDGRQVPLVLTKVNVFDPKDTHEIKSWFNPWTVFIPFLILVLTISYRDFSRKKISNWLDVPLFSITGLLGLLLLLLWTATDHKAATNNLNILWALPTHAFAGVILLRKQKPGWLRLYFLATALIAGLILLLWPWWPQHLNEFLIPVILSLGIRALTQFKHQATAA
jgi:Domain of unknown function (DUF4105)